MDTITSFDVQMSQAQNQTRQSFRKRATGTATGVAAIAVVTCITLLIVNAGSQRNNSSVELSIPQSSQNLRSEIFIEKNQFKQFMQLQKHNIIHFENIAEHIYSLFQPDQVQLERITNLFVQYVFDLIDSNDNNIVDRPEWNAFFGAIFPQDYEYFNKLYESVNTKFPFKIDVFKKFIFDQEKKQQQTPPPQLKTNPKVATNNFGKLVIKDDNNYKKTYTFIFNIFDINGDKAVTKSEYIKLVTGFGTPKAKAEEDAGKLFQFAQQNRFGTADTIKFSDWSSFAEAIKKPLQDMLNKNTTMLLKIQLQQQQLLAVLSESTDIYHATIETVQKQLDLQSSGKAEWNEEQQKLIDHLLKVIAQYEFNLLDSNNDKVISRSEYISFINSIFKKQADRQHFYSEFDAINGGKDVTYDQFIQYYKKEISESSSEDVDDDFEFKPHEKSKKIGKRIAKLLINNDRNYELTSRFVFDLFDVTEDSIVSVNEILNIFKTFNCPQDQFAKFEQNVHKVFDTLKEQGVGDGNQITLAQWTEFAKKIRPELVKEINKALFFLQFVATFQLEF